MANFSCDIMHVFSCKILYDISYKILQELPCKIIKEFGTYPGVILPYLYVRSWQTFLVISCMYFLAGSYMTYITRSYKNYHVYDISYKIIQGLPCKITKEFGTYPVVILPYFYVRSWQNFLAISCIIFLQDLIRYI